MLLNYVHYQNVNGAKQTIDYVRQFAVAQGWTQEYWLEDSYWDTSISGGYSDWLTWTGASYLVLSNTGYGTQSLVCRMAAYPVNGDAFFNLRMCSSASPTINTGTGDVPYMINSYTDAPNNGDVTRGQTEMMHIGTATYDDLWIFGDGKWICAVLSMDGVFCQSFWFGSPIMFEDNPSQGMGYGVSYVKEYNNVHWWYNWNGADEVGWPWWPMKRTLDDEGWLCHPTMDFYYNSRPAFDDNGSSSDVCHIYYNVHYWDDPSADAPSPFNDSNLFRDPILNLGQCLQANDWSGKRPMFRQTIFINDASNLVQPIGMLPNYLCRFSGLQIGQTLTYGSEEYLVFPIHSVNDIPGIAFRIT